MKSDKYSIHVSSTILALLFSTTVLGTYGVNKISVKADQVMESEEVTEKRDIHLVQEHKQQGQADEINKSTAAINSETKNASLDDQVEGNNLDNFNVENNTQSTEISNENKKYSENQEIKQDSSSETSKDVQESEVKENPSTSEGKTKSENQEKENKQLEKTENEQEQISDSSENKNTAKANPQQNEAILDYDENGNMIFTDKDDNQYRNQFVEYDGNTYYSDEQGIVVQDRWVDYGSNRYYFGYDGQMSRGGSFEVQDPSNGDYKHYLFSKDGSLIQKQGWDKYYTPEGDYLGWIYVNSDNSLAEDFQEINGHNFYFDYNQIMVSDGVTEVNNSENDTPNYYLFDKNGYQVKHQGWYKYRDQEHSYWVYFKTDNSLLNDWQEINGHTFYFDYGEMVKGVLSQYDDKNENYKYYYFDENGYELQEKGWAHYYDDQEKSTKWIYVSDDHSLKDGWQSFGGHTYYFDSAIMLANTTYDVYDENKTYLFDKSGYLVGDPGWHRYKNIQFDGYDSGWFYVNSDHSVATYWKKIGNHRYNFSYDGLMSENGIYFFDDEEGVQKAYLFDRNGYQIDDPGWHQSKYVDVDGFYSGWYYINSDTSLADGWTKIGSNTYYFQGEMLADGRYNLSNDEVNEKYYLFDKNGLVVDKPGWVNLDNMWSHVNNDGSLANNWAKIGSHTYYFYSGVMVASTVQPVTNDDGETSTNYLFDRYGYLLSKPGFLKYNGIWYFINTDGSLAEGWKKISGYYYYFDENSEMVSDGPSYIEKSRGNYLFDKNGRVTTSIGWHMYDGSYYYVKDNGGRLASDWYKVGNTKFYFYDSGEMLANDITYKDGYLVFVNGAGYVVTKEGLYQIGGTNGFKTFVKNDGTVAVDEWIKVNSSYYYADGSGYLAQNEALETVNGQIYVFDKNGEYFNLTGFVTLYRYGKETYYLQNGVALKNQWKQINGSWYYFDPSGVQASNKVIKDNYGTTYLFYQDGSFTRQSGWHQGKNIFNENAWFYFDANQQLLKSKWLHLGQDWYYFDEDGQMIAGQSMFIDPDSEKYYYFDGQGHWKTNGWVKADNSWYYLKNGAVLAQGWQNIDGKAYYVDFDGLILASDLLEDENGKYYVFDKYGNYTSPKSGWYSNGNDWYYFHNSDSLAKGWEKIGSSWYYFDDSGCMLANQTEYINETKYLFDLSGKMVSEGLIEIYDGSSDYKYQYVSADGAVTKDAWKKIGNSWYYFGNEGFAYSDSVHSVNGQDYYFDESGKTNTKNSWVFLKGSNDYYYFKDGKVLRNQWKKINNTWYYFGSDGLMIRGTAKIDGKYQQFNENGSWINS